MLYLFHVQRSLGSSISSFCRGLKASPWKIYLDSLGTKFQYRRRRARTCCVGLLGVRVASFDQQSVKLKE